MIHYMFRRLCVLNVAVLSTTSSPILWLWNIRGSSFEALKVTHKRQFWLCRRASPSQRQHSLVPLFTSKLVVFSQKCGNLSPGPVAGWWPCRGLGGAQPGPHAWLTSSFLHLQIESWHEMPRSHQTQCTPQHGDGESSVWALFCLLLSHILLLPQIVSRMDKAIHFTWFSLSFVTQITI